MTGHKRSVACATGILVSLFLLVPLRADTTDEEKRLLKTAGQSFKEGAFDLTNSRVATLLRKYPKSELAPQAELLQAQALYQLGKSDAAVTALNLSADQMPPELWDDALFWQSQALLDIGKWPEAEAKFRALLALKDLTDHADAANLGLAWALYNQGKEADATPVIQALIKNNGGNSTGQQAQLLQAKIQLAKKDFKGAIATLESLLASSPEKGIALETDYWLGETYAANGQPEKAAVAYQRITGDPQAFPRLLVARAWLGLGRSQHTLAQNDQAMLAYEQTFHLSENAATQLDAFRSYLESARASGQLNEGVAKLQEFAKSSDPAAPGALFAIGSALADNHNDDRAIGILESLLVAYPTSPWIPAANVLLGQLYSRTNKVNLAVKALQAGIAANSDPQLVRTARSQLGYVFLKQAHDYAAAAAQFAQISDGTDAASENASYNYLLALANLGKTDTYLKAESDFEKRFPKSSYAKAIALAGGQLLANAGKTDDAKAVYQKAIATGGNSPDQESLLKALNDLLYQTNDLASTLVTCNQLVAQFPNSALAAAQRAVLVKYELKQFTDDQVEQELVKLAQKYNNMPGAPEAYFRLGEFYFYRQDYVRAQDAFQQLTANYPTSDNAVPAYFFAGRSAFAHQDYNAARTLLEKIPDSSSLKADARLWEGRVYQQQLNFTAAEGMYDAVLATEKAGPLFVEASLLKGQCLFALGAQDAANYSQAQAAFDQVLKSKEGTIAERNEAAVRSAKCLEKMGKVDDALGLYLEVLYGREAGDDAASVPPPEFYWQFEAGSQAGRIREARKDWRGAIEVYKRLEQIGGSHAPDFHDLINKLRRDNYIYE